jgi:cellulose synthase (UDP-forming)
MNSNDVGYHQISLVSYRHRMLVLGTTFATTIGLAFVIAAFSSHVQSSFLVSDYGRIVETISLYGIIFILFYSIIVFCIADYGCHRRLLASGILARAEIEAIYGTEVRKDLLILVPSYKEQEDVVRRTLISAALVEYPGRKVMLLIDDPSPPATAEDASGLEASRRLSGELQTLFAAPARYMGCALSTYCDRAQCSAVDIGFETARLARLYERAAQWLEALAASLPENKTGLSHTERLFIDRILRAPARAHREWAAELRQATLSADRVDREYRRLAVLFRVEFGSFERKRYANLSHAPNKAMNLNSYLALVGKSLHEMTGPDGCRLEGCSDEHATLRVPAVDYIATLDADSLMTWDYALRLVPNLEQLGNERIAIAQTPYTAIPNPPVPLERVASASTDAQFFNHQGMAYLDASFWVGASALMRHTALQDIAVEREERGHKVKVYIDDQILIEDAAATVDLLEKGWHIYHDRRRLSYSATPADFGALLIQRRRWANGGLLILPRLLRYAFRRPWSFRKLAEAVLRIPNLMAASIAGVGLPILLLYRFDDSLVPLWMPLVVVPYYLLYGADLRLAGYRWTDLPRVYALNVLLIPVNLSGTIQSVRQVFTGRPVPFQRTPKVAGRTRTPLVYLAVAYGFCGYALLCAVFDGMAGRWTHMAYALLNGVASTYGIVVFIGLKASRDDMRARMTVWQKRPRAQAKRLMPLIPARNRV